MLFVSPVGHAADTVLTVTGEVKTPLKLTLAELESMPAQTVSVKDPDGSTASYKGVLLHAVLARAGIPEGQSLRGLAMQLCVLVKATDGYKVAFSLAELDPLFGTENVLLAYRRDGKELDVKSGPLRLVVPSDKHQGRWVREVTGLEIIRLANANLKNPS